MRTPTPLFALLVIASAAIALTGPSCSRPVDRSDADTTRAGSTAAAGADSVPAAAMARSIDAFAAALHGELRGRSGNLVHSPLSISSALGLTVAGAAGETREEMRRVLHLPADDAAAYEGYRALYARFQEFARDGGVRWNLANRLWLQEGTTLLPAYVATTERVFGAKSGTLDFARAPEPSRVTINDWVADQTEDRIKDLFPPGSIGPDTRVVLANAIWFKGKWATTFDVNRTRPVPFHRGGGATVDVPTMHRNLPRPVAAIAGARLLELPYQGDRLGMLLVLPDAVDGLPAVESRLGADSLRAWAAALAAAPVPHGGTNIALPKFTARTRLELNGTLAALGMPTAFDAERADFSGMNGGRDLSIAVVVHQAFVDVDEEGTEAAAATGVAVRTTSVTIPQEFHVDRPFLWFIRDRATGTVLFMGRVVDPTAAAD
jgi:serpin B